METYHPIQPIQQNQSMQSPQLIRSQNYYEVQKQGVFYDPHALSRLREVFLIAMIAVSILTLISLFELKPATQYGWAFFLNHCFGKLSYSIPLMFVYVGCALYSHWRNLYQSSHILILKLAGACLFFFSIEAIGQGGELGVALSHSFFGANSFESWVFVLTVLVSSIFLMTKL